MTTCRVGAGGRGPVARQFSLGFLTPARLTPHPWLVPFLDQSRTIE